MNAIEFQAVSHDGIMEIPSKFRMLEQLFVDTSYVIALINENDRNHGQALALADLLEGTLFRS